MRVSGDALGDQRAQVIMQDRGPVADRVEILDEAENLVSGDLTAFNLEAGRWYCMTVPTRPITWGHVKSLYRQ